MLCKEVIGVCSESLHNKGMEMCGQNVEFFSVIIWWHMKQPGP